MSTRYPGTARKYDLYVSTTERIEIGRVLFAGSRRFVIREAMTRESWDAERAIPPESDGPGRLLGSGSLEDQPTETPGPHKPADAVPADDCFFYGADAI